MEAIFKVSQEWFNTGEVKVINDRHHSTKAKVLAHAVSKGEFSDTDYFTSTFPVMVQCHFLTQPAAQPVILCLADTLAEIKGACMCALGADENSLVSLEVLWAYNNLPGAVVRSLKLSEGNVRATLRILKARAGLDLLNVAHYP